MGKRWNWVHVLADAYVRILGRPAAVDGEVFVITYDQRPTAVEMQRAATRSADYTGEITLETAQAGA
ncbi:hypothetical protein [Streptomyces sp. NPDC051662]|uniref:hypothetical protein n=1 Tax=Streptomyces sp. NPDC051662 TaxID=3154750 RepID=UPI0034214057